MKIYYCPVAATEMIVERIYIFANLRRSKKIRKKSIEFLIKYWTRRTPYSSLKIAIIMLDLVQNNERVSFRERFKWS